MSKTVPAPVEQRAGVTIVPATEMPFTESGDGWQMEDLARISVPTLFRAAVAPELCDAAPWLRVANNSRVNLLTPGEKDETRNAFSVHLGAYAL